MQVYKHKRQAFAMCQMGCHDTVVFFFHVPLIFEKYVSDMYHMYAKCIQVYLIYVSLHVILNRTI